MNFYKKFSGHFMTEWNATLIRPDELFVKESSGMMLTHGWCDWRVMTKQILVGYLTLQKNRIKIDNFLFWGIKFFYFTDKRSNDASFKMSLVRIGQF